MTVTQMHTGRALPDFVGPAPTEVEMAEAELIAAGFTFTVVDTHSAAACGQDHAVGHSPLRCAA
jgi:hypothetical protein